MTTLDHLVLVGAAAVALLPGVALLLALRIRTPLLFVALMPTSSIAVLLFVATACASLGLRYSPLTVVIATIVLTTVGIGRWIRSRPTLRAPRRRPSIPTIVGIGGVVIGGLVAARTWLRGFGGLDRIAQEHDMITHQVVVAYIARTGRAAPWEIRPVDVLTGSPVTFYPQGGHLAPAVLSELGVGPVAALNALTVVYLAGCWVLSAAVLTAVAARRLRPGTAIPWLAAGTAAIVAAALYRPGFQLMHDGGIYPAAVALALSPGLLAALLLVPEEARPRTALALGAASAGLIAVHPSAAVTVGLSLVAWVIGDLVGPHGRDRVRRSAVTLVGAGALAGVLALPVVLQGGGGVAATSAFRTDRSAYPAGDALGSAIGLVYGGFLDPRRAVAQLALAALYLVGVLVVVRAGKSLGVVAAWATWAAVTFSTMLAPGVGPARLVTGFFYTDLPRIWSHVSLFVPTLAALGVTLTSAVLATSFRRRLPARLPRLARVKPIASVLIIVAMAGLLAVPVHRAMVTNTAAVAARYAEPDFVRVGDDDLAAVAFLQERVAPGERVLNSANDGSTFLYVDAGIPVVNVSSLGTGAAPYTFELMRSFSRYPSDPTIRNMLRELDVGWVYVDTRAPVIGASGAPRNWAGSSVPFTVPAGLMQLDRVSLPGLTPEFRQGSVSVYRLDLDRIG